VGNSLLVGNGGVAKWELTGWTVEPLLQNLTHHIQMLTYFTNHNHLHWEMESWPTKKWGIGEKKVKNPCYRGWRVIVKNVPAYM